MHRPKLLIAATVPSHLEAFHLPIARHFRSLGWDVDAATAPGLPRGWHADCFDEVAAIEWSRNPMDVRNVRRAARQVRDFVATRGHDIVHVHTPVAAFVTRFAMRSLPARSRPTVVYTAHGFHFHPNGNALANVAILALEKLAGRWTDLLVVMNEHDAAAVRAHRIVPHARLRQMPGVGIDLGKYAPVGSRAGSTFRESIGLAASDQFVLMVAEFNPGKRHEDAIAALELVRRDWSGPRLPTLVFAGTGRREAHLRRVVERRGLADAVRFLGYRSDIPEILREASALVLPSVREGLPRCVLEAMAARVPVVASDVRGNRDLLGSGGGILVPLGDIPGYAAALTKLLAHSDAVVANLQAAAAHIEHYSIDNVTALHEGLYAEALGLRVERSVAP